MTDNSTAQTTQASATSAVTQAVAIDPATDSSHVSQETPDQPVPTSVTSQATSPSATSQGASSQTANSQTASPQTSSQSTNSQAIPPKKDFDIPDLVREKYADLIDLILQTESMNDEERQYWFHILPIMTVEQVNKFRGILVKEKEQLSKLDKEYEEELKRINETKIASEKSQQSAQKRKELRAQEKKNEEEEKKQEENILKKLSEI